MYNPSSSYPAMGEGDGLPATGAIGGAPMQHNIKRAVVKPPPRAFTVKVLDPVRHGGAFSYGIRVCPVIRDFEDGQSSRSSRSSGSSGSMKEYEVWRRWEDCLWFQELLEDEYSHMARLKRQRLAAGKGVKKDGMYKHPDQAASFDSLPPGPEVNSVAKDVHSIIPKLSRKGTLFRPSQATVDQRGREFRAMIEALFEEDVPTLIKELRDSRVIRDFFAYWRRDKDREKKMNEKSTTGASTRNSRASIASSAFSMYFSSSNISLQLPNAYSDLPPSPTSARQPSRTNVGVDIGPTPLSSRVNSMHSPTAPASAPAAMTFTVNKHGSLASAALDDFGTNTVAESQSRVHSSHTTGRRPRAMSLDTHLQDVPVETDEFVDELPIIFSPEDQDWSQSLAPERPSTLEVLPEEDEMASGMSGMTLLTEDLPPPTPRRLRNDSFPERGSHRNAMVFASSAHEPTVVDPDGVLTVEGMHPHDEVQSIADTVDTVMAPKYPHTNSSASTYSSTSFSNMSDSSSWRASIASFTSFAPSASTDCFEDAMAEVEQALADSERRPRHAPRASVATMNSILSDSSVDAVIPKRFMQSTPTGLRRSLSAGSQRRAVPTLTIPTEEVWYEQQEELIDAYFYDPTLRSSAENREEALEGVPVEVPEEIPEEPPHTPGRERISQSVTQSISTPERYPRPFQNRPPGQFHLPWSPEATSPTPTSASSLRSASNADTFTIKVAQGETAVLLRAAYTMSLDQVRERIKDKFASQEGISLSPNFVVAIATSATMKAPRGRPRSHSTSAVGLVNTSGLRYITTEFEWQELISTCSSKLTLRIIH